MNDDRINRVEDRLEKKIDKLDDKMSKIQISIKAIETKQKTTFNLGSWAINTLITTSIAVLTIIYGGNFFKK